jgi:hypothetical protein
MEPWFGPKSIGLGVGPRGLPGFAVVLIFCIGIGLIFGNLGPSLIRLIVMVSWVLAFGIVVKLTYRSR